MRAKKPQEKSNSKEIKTKLKTRHLRRDSLQKITNLFGANMTNKIDKHQLRTCSSIGFLKVKKSRIRLIFARHLLSFVSHHL